MTASSPQQRRPSAAFPPATRAGRASVTRLVPLPATSSGTVDSQGMLALDLDRSRGRPPRTPELDRTHRSRVQHTDDEEVRAWAATFAQAVVESVGGQRPVAQLVRWTAPTLFRDLERRTRLVQQARGPAARSVRPQVRSVHVCRPDAQVAEVSVHVREGARSRALALRLERRQGRWLCTVLDFG